VSTAVRGALERAHAFRTAAAAFGVPLDPPALASELRTWSARAPNALADALARAVAALEDPGAGLEDEHERLLGGRGQAVPCRETSYVDARRIAPVDLADLAGFLRAFALESVAAPPDHVSAECELASWLALKEAYALAEGWSERAEIASDAYQRLLASHLASWLPRFAARLRGAAEHPFHMALADVLERFVAEETSRLGVAVDALDAGPASDDSHPFACGGCRAGGNRAS
jgi:TorA maturation chaperone TorD